MKALLTGIVVAIVLAVGAGYFLTSESRLAWQAYSTNSVRVGDPGSNLVGPRWTGENQVAPEAPGENEADPA